LLQTTFDIAKLVFHSKVDIKLTTNSGADVPKATTVNHITNDDIQSLLAMLQAQSTSI
jgi:hypothetical protein